MASTENIGGQTTSTSLFSVTNGPIVEKRFTFSTTFSSLFVNELQASFSVDTTHLLKFCTVQIKTDSVNNYKHVYSQISPSLETNLHRNLVLSS